MEGTNQQRRLDLIRLMHRRPLPIHLRHLLRRPTQQSITILALKLVRELLELHQVRDAVERGRGGEDLGVVAHGGEDGEAAGGAAADGDALRVDELVARGEEGCGVCAVTDVDDAPGAFQAGSGWSRFVSMG